MLRGLFFDRSHLTFDVGADHILDSNVIRVCPIPSYVILFSYVYIPFIVVYSTLLPFIFFDFEYVMFSYFIMLSVFSILLLLFYYLIGSHVTHVYVSY